jgi:hypothetical protein
MHTPPPPPPPHTHPHTPPLHDTVRTACEMLLASLRLVALSDTLSPQQRGYLEDAVAYALTLCDP